VKTLQRRIETLEGIIKSHEFEDPRFERILIRAVPVPTPEELEAATVKALERRQPYRFRRGETVPGCALVLRNQEGELIVMCSIDRRIHGEPQEVRQ